MINKNENRPLSKFIKKKHHTYEELLSKSIQFKPNKKGITPFTVVNGILLMFPCSSAEDNLTTGTWACKCFCGEHFITNYTQVIRKVTKSCGCIVGMKNRWKMAIIALKEGADKNIHIHKLPSEYRSRDAELTCNICETRTDRGHFTEHLVSGHKFCKCSLKFKYSATDLKKECEAYSKNTTWNIINFPENYETKTKLRLHIKCKVCNHENDMSYGNFMKGRGCVSCANKNTSELLNKDLSYFIEKSVGQHGHRYDYSQVVYNKCREPVNIICRQHGVFQQSPDNHYNKGKGCPTCSRLKMKNVTFHYSNVENNKEKYLKLPSSVYIMRVGEFIKVGISILPEKRAKDIARASKRDVEILYYRNIDLYNAFYLEKKLHGFLHNFRQDYSIFQGYTECFIIEDDLIPPLMMSIYCYKELK